MLDYHAINHKGRISVQGTNSMAPIMIPVCAFQYPTCYKHTYFQISFVVCFLIWECLWAVACPLSLPTAKVFLVCAHCPHWPAETRGCPVPTLIKLLHGMPPPPNTLLSFSTNPWMDVKFLIKWLSGATGISPSRSARHCMRNTPAGPQSFRPLLQKAKSTIHYLMIKGSGGVVHTSIPSLLQFCKYPNHQNPVVSCVFRGPSADAVSSDLLHDWVSFVPQVCINTASRLFCFSSSPWQRVCTQNYDGDYVELIILSRRFCAILLVVCFKLSYPRFPPPLSSFGAADLKRSSSDVPRHAFGASLMVEVWQRVWHLFAARRTAAHRQESDIDKFAQLMLTINQSKSLSLFHSMAALVLDNLWSLVVEQHW